MQQKVSIRGKIPAFFYYCQYKNRPVIMSFPPAFQQVFSFGVQASRVLPKPKASAGKERRRMIMFDKKEYLKKYYQEHKEKIKERAAKSRQKNPEKAKEYRKEYYRKNKDKAFEYNYEWVKNNREKHREYDKKWKEKNPEKRKQVVRENVAKRKHNKYYCFVNNLRTRVKSVLKNKTKKTDKYLGMNYKEYKEYIEGLFYNGMSWENWGQGSGKWQIHHLIPLHTAEDEEELVHLLHYSNTIPLWFEDHLETHKYLTKAGL